MSPPGYVFKDGGAIPDSEQSSTSTSSNRFSKISRPQDANEKPAAVPTTDSHALAQSNHDEKGAVQENEEQAHDDEVKNMGWHDHPTDVPKPLIGGLPNEDLWILIRRFNKQMYHVKAMKGAPLNALDLNIAEDEEFSPDKLRGNVERVYMTVLIGFIGFGKHIVRLRSWREPKRTSLFCVAYTIAWVFNLLIPLLLSTLIVLITVPASRALLFPPAPIALVDSKTGGAQSPPTGVLGSHDSATGAAEAHRGEAVENEARNFVSGIGTIALSSAVGKHERGSPETSPFASSIVDPTKVASVSVDAKVAATGSTTSAVQDKTKQPMEEKLWSQMRPIAHMLGDAADGWERFANALSPTSPFPLQKPRMTLASVLAPLLAISIVTSAAVFIKVTSAIVGLAFFTDPLMWRALKILNERIPDWQKYLELRNSVLQGVPTNAQLTLTLLRTGEANKAPLPPPPSSKEEPSSRPASINGDDLALDTSDKPLGEAIHMNEAEKQRHEDYVKRDDQKHGHENRIVRFLKGTTSAGVGTKLGLDKVKARVLGSEHAKSHLGILPKTSEILTSGPVDFKARFEGNKGYAYITTCTLTPTLSFSSESTEGTGELMDHQEKPLWRLVIEDIQEIKKFGGLGWKAKIVVHWATGKDVANGLCLIMKDGRMVKLTAVPLRDEMFNRLISIGKQRWESW